MKVLHILASNQFSGAENVACQIINMFKGEIDMAYCSPNGPIASSLADRGVNFLPLNNGMSIKELKKVVNLYKPDIIHAHDAKAGVLTALFSKKNKLILHLHGNKKVLSKFGLKSLSYYYAIKKSYATIFVSDSCFDDFYFKEKIRKKAVILYNIINASDILESIKKDDNNYDFDCVYLGRLSYIKNPLLLISIVAEVVKVLPNFKIAIVGDGELRQECENKAKELRCYQNITFFGYKRNPYKILNSSKFMIMTSINEGTPMCALEALSLGKPIVCTPVDGLKDIIINGVNGFFATETEEFVNYIVKLVNDNEFYKMISNQTIKQYNDYFDIKKYKDIILKLYNN